MIKILICGPTQCGSTRIFNLVRLLFEKQNKTVASKWISAPAPTHNPDVLVVKCHDTNLDNLKRFKYVILPKRDPRDAAISHAKRFFNPAQSKNISEYILFMVHFIQLYRKFRAHASHIFTYETYSPRTIQELASAIEVPTDIDTIHTIMKELDELHSSKDIVKKDNHKDPLYAKTLMSQSHNTSGGQSQKYRTYFTPAQQKTILNHQLINGFLKFNQYLEPAVAELAVAEPAVAELAEPSVAESTVAEPAVTQPDVAEPDVAEPDVAEPDVAEPDVAKSAVTQPAVAEPAVAEPAVTQPAVAEPDVDEPGVAEPAVVQPAVVQPVVAEPGVAEPAVAQPAVDEPVVVEPAVDEPAVDELAVAEPGVAEPAVTQPAVVEPGVVEPERSALGENNSKDT